MTIRHWPTLHVCALLGLCAGLSGCRRAAPPNAVANSAVVQPVVRQSSLDLAWRFASGIDNDPDDRAACQAKVASAHLAAGDRRMALELGRKIVDWRKGLVLAKAAEQAVRAGETQAGLDLALEAEAVAGATEDWPRDRIRMTLANTVVLLEATNALERLAERYATDKEYGGQIAAAQALRMGRQGHFPEALALLDALNVSNAFDKAAWRTRGYGLLAREAGASQAAVAGAALDRMWAATGDTPGRLGFELRLDVVDGALAAGLADVAARRLREVDETLAAEPGPRHVMVPVQLRLARTWTLAGDRSRALALVETVLRNSRDGIMDIERPGLLGSAAETVALAGDAARAAALFLEAIEAAAGVANRRPRCLSLCDIALALQASGLGDGAPLAALQQQAHVLEGR